MPPISSFSGLLSGIDFQSLIDEIIRAESEPIRQMEGRISRIQRRSDAFVSFEGKVQSFEGAAETLREGDVFDRRTVATSTTASETQLTASASDGAALGSSQVEVLSLATAEKLGSGSFGSSSDALGLSGEFSLNGTAISVAGTDSLQNVADAINDANTGVDATGVQASVLQVADGENRLVLTAQEQGADGIELADGASGVLRDLGFLDGTTSVKHQTSDGAKSDGFANAVDAVADLRGFASPPAAADVTIGGFTVNLDLANDSLNDVRDKINSAAAGAGSDVTASVVEETVDGETVRRLDIDHTTSFADQNRILESLGILEGGRSDVAEKLRSSTTLQQSDGSTNATTGTLLTDLHVNGSDAGVQSGDTIDISGTLGDGTSFSTTFTVGSGADGTTVQDLLDKLNGSGALGSGSRSATATLDAGNIVVTDDTGGESQLSLSLVANNEGGGTLDFGTVDTVREGRSRVITDGTDAELEVDGVFLSRSSNTVDDAVDGVTLNLKDATPGETTTVEVGRDREAVVKAAEEFVSAFNGIAKFVREQSTPPAEGEPDKPLSGSATLRTMSLRLRRSLQATVTSGVAGDFNRLADVGIEIQKDGSFSLDKAALKSALDADPAAVKDLFTNTGETTSSQLEFVQGTDATESGDFAVDITQVADRAQATGSGFDGTFDDASDTLTVKDVGSGDSISLDLTNKTLTEIVDGLNARFDKELAHRLEASESLEDASGNPADASTLLQDVHQSDGTDSGIADGDTITISGKRDDGTSFSTDFEVTDVTSQTLGDVVSEAQQALGDDFDVFLDSSGNLRADAREKGSSLAELTVTSDNAGGGSFTVGTVDTVQEGRGSIDIEASNASGELQLTHGDFGSGEGFDVSFADGTSTDAANLIPTGTFTGTDVQGTIGGLSATGSGQLLTGDDGSAVEGLSVRFTGSSTGTAGDVTFSRGIASTVEEEAEPLIGTGPGSIQDIVDRGDDRIARIEDRIADFETRLEDRRAALRERFIAVERALARAQRQSQFISSRLGGGGGGGLSSLVGS